MSVRISRERLAVAMIRSDLNVTQLAEESGVSRCTITAIRNGKSCSKQTADKLVSVLGRSILKGE